MVSAGRPCGRAGRTKRCAWVHGHSPVGLRDLGEHATSARRNVSRDRTSQRLFSAFHSAKLFRQGSGARRRLRQGMRGGHAHALGSRWHGKIKTGQCFERAPRSATNLRDNHRRELREVGAIVSRSADLDQSVGERGAVGNAAALVSADD